MVTTTIIPQCVLNHLPSYAVSDINVNVIFVSFIATLSCDIIYGFNKVKVASNPNAFRLEMLIWIRIQGEKFVVCSEVYVIQCDN